MDGASLLSYSTQEGDLLLGCWGTEHHFLQPNQGRRKWIHEENTELMVCYYSVALSVCGMLAILVSALDLKIICVVRLVLQYILNF